MRKKQCCYVIYRGEKWAKSTRQNSKSTGFWLVDNGQVRALLQYHLTDLAGENSLSENNLGKRYPQHHKSMNQSPSHTYTSCRLLQDYTHKKTITFPFLRHVYSIWKELYCTTDTTLLPPCLNWMKLNNCPLFSLSIFVYSHISFVSF